VSQLNDILERIASIQNTISSGSGASTVTCIGYPYIPADPSSAQCPFFVNEIAGGPTDFLATAGRQKVHDNIRMILCLAREESDSTFTQVIEKAAEWRDYVFNTFAAKIRLGNDLSYVQWAVVDKWDYVRYPMGTTIFIALMFNLHVLEAYITTIAP
jgi:hypothetical protein